MLSHHGEIKVCLTRHMRQNLVKLSLQTAKCLTRHVRQNLVKLSLYRQQNVWPDTWDKILLNCLFTDSKISEQTLEHMRQNLVKLSLYKRQNYLYFCTIKKDPLGSTYTTTADRGCWIVPIKQSIESLTFKKPTCLCRLCINSSTTPLV